MTVKIRVQNFQSIEDSEVEISGLTVITGPNNRGKSALHRALHGAFTNSRGDFFVRYGTPHCTVTISFDDGHTLVWEKGPKVNGYVLNGKPFNKVGAGVVPPEVQNLKIAPIIAGGRELWPQFANQFTGQVFLLDQPGSVLAESIADVTRVGVLNEALRNTQSEARSLRSELKVRISDVGKLEVQESTFAGLDQVEALAREVEALEAEVERTQEQRAAVMEYHKGLRELTDAVSDLLPARWVEEPQSARPMLGEFKDLQEAEELRQNLRALTEFRDNFSAVGQIQGPEDSMVLRTTKILDALSLLRGITVQMTPLRESVTRLEGVRRVTASVADQLPLEQMRVLEECLRIRDGIVARKKEVESLRVEGSTLAEQHELAVHDVIELLGGVGDCPICGKR